MSLLAPPRPPAPGDSVEREEPEALIEEARRRARRRRQLYAATTALVALGGVAVFGALQRSASSPGASLERPTAPNVSAEPMGAKIAFVRYHPRSYGPAGRPAGEGALYVVNADGSGERQLARSVGDERVHAGYAWSPDRRQIAFEALNGSSDIYVINSDGSGRRRLTRSPAREESPHWSPDGRTISFVRWSPSRGTFAIYEVSADGSRTRRLTSELAAGAQGPGWPGRFAWSPDGRGIAFHRLEAGNIDVWVVNADGTGLRNLTRSPLNEFAREWSPDGRKIIISQASRTAIVFGTANGFLVVNADGSGLRRLTNAGRSDVAWSPDGRKLALATVRYADDGRISFFTEVYVMNADGSGLRKLARHEGKPPAGVDASVAWSRDGRRIAFTSGRDGNSEIYSMDPDGSDLRRLTHNPGWELAPLWSPAP